MAENGSEKKKRELRPGRKAVVDDLAGKKATPRRLPRPGITVRVR
jgi:hypothetical protein